MEFFGKKFSSALLFGSMIFSTVNGVSVYGAESDTIVEQVAEELGDASDDVQGLAEDGEKRLTYCHILEGRGENESSGSKLGFGLAGAAGGALIGVAAEETVKYFKKSKKSGEVTPGSSGTDDRNEVKVLEEELNKARSESNNFQSELKSSNKELDKLRSDLKKMKQSEGGTSVLDAIGGLSYIPGIGSDCKTDSGINAGKLATAIIMHVIGIIFFAALIYSELTKRSELYWYDYVSMGCDLICPPVGIVTHAGRFLYYYAYD